tara:strand:- start:182 stop:1414 length:1233 start_codon:yes stop_codon:yes gene_type:complete
VISSKWSRISGGISTPSGFKASGVHAGLKLSNAPDLALILAPQDAVCAGTFTSSSVRAACVDLCKQRLDCTGGKARAILINSGHANACTGDRGLIDSLRATEAIANQLGLLQEEVLICSTGVIGELIPMQKLIAGIDPLLKDLADDGGTNAANAILTTDLIKKQIAIEAFLGGRRVRIGGMAKGSGMIHPDMATMLAFLSCDVGLSADVWSQMIKRVTNLSFNAITVDGDTSTNDSFIAFAAGDQLDQKYLYDLELGLVEVTQYLAKAIARDGEGSNCLIEVKIEGSNSSENAIKIARTIASSSLVKTAINGMDPNWGRIVAALGRSGVDVDLKEVSLWIGPYQLMKKGEPAWFSKKEVSAYIKNRMNAEYLDEDTVSIRLIIGEGNASGLGWGCDLSEQYVHINAEYTT